MAAVCNFSLILSLQSEKFGTDAHYRRMYIYVCISVAKFKELNK